MMVQLHSVSDQEQVADTTIGLTHPTHLHRTIVAGSGSMKFHLALRRRGFGQMQRAA
jgi:hypothetical protein